MLFPSPLPKISPAMAGSYAGSVSSSSNYSADSYRPRKEKVKKKKKDQVSHWRKEDLDEKNIFFDNSACKLHDFIVRVKDNVTARRGKLFNCPSDLPDFVKELMKYTKESLSFSYEQASDDAPVKESIYDAYQDACTAIKEFDSYVCKLMDENKELDHRSRKFLNAWCTNTEDFLQSLKLFFLTKLVDAKDSRLEGQFQELLMDFTRIFFMKPKIGNARKRELEINNINVSSIPDIHYITDCQSPLFGTLLVMCVEVKGTPLDSATLKESFKANEMIDSQTLGQHGGELLLEISHSAFEPKVLGMICHKSKIIFTFMDMKSSHYEIILAQGQVTDRKHNCTIYYTRPYDFLVKDDRDEILEILFWIGCMSKTMK